MMMLLLLDTRDGLYICGLRGQMVSIFGVTFTMIAISFLGFDIDLL